MIYLGGLLSDDGHIASELGRRIGLAHSEFSTLHRIWSHANLSIAKKLPYYNTFVISKLLFAVDGLWLPNTELKRLDAFHCMCIRRILKIQHSFYSRISNGVVLQRAKVQPLSCILVKRQLKLFARIAILPNAKDLRGIVFNDNSFTKPQCGPRRRGRPRVCWIDEMHKLALRIAGSHAHLSSLLSQCKSSMKPWLDAVHTDFSQSNID